MYIRVYKSHTKDEIMKADNIKYIEDDREYVLLRPNIYIGSIAKNKVETYLLNKNKFIKEYIEYTPALIKLFDEIIINSVDESIKTDNKFANKIEVKTDVHGRISISDNGRGLSSEIEETTQLPQAVVAFTKLKAGSNFDESENTYQNGQNGVGASLVNIFSKEFTVETCDGIKKTHLVCKNNLNTFTYNQRKYNKQYTKIEFKPDYERLNSALDETHIRLIEKRLINLALTYPNISFIFNGKKLPNINLKTYAQFFSNNFFQYSTDTTDIIIIPFQQQTEYITFVNGVDTYKHGQHLTVFQRAINKALKDTNKRIFQNLNSEQLLTNCKIIIVVKQMNNPRFSAQIKDELTNPYTDVKDHMQLDLIPFLDQLARDKNYLKSIQEYAKAIENVQELQKIKKEEKKLKKQKIVKYLPPISKKLSDCHLYICEGDSALAQLINVRDKFTAGYPLKGKIINPRTATAQKLLQNETITDLVSILGLKLSSKDISNFRFKSIRILTDADTDGNCICMQLINIFQLYWPELIKQNKISRVLTPLILAKKDKQIKEFYSLEEYYKYQKEYKIIEYNKGLGSLNKNQYAKIITAPKLINFNVTSESERLLDMIFGESKEDERKEWLNG